MSDNGFPQGNIIFAGLQLFKHILFTSCFVIETYEIGLLCSAHAALVRVLQTAFGVSLNRNVFAQLSEFFSASVFLRNSMVRKDTICQVRTTNTKFRLHSKLNSYTCVYALTNQTLQKTQAEPSPLLADHKVINTCTKLHQFRSVN